MALRKNALRAIIAVALFLALTVAPTWFMAFPIMFGLIALAVKKKEEEQTLPVSPSGGDAMTDASTPAAAVVAPEVHRREREEPTLQVSGSVGDASAPAPEVHRRKREEPTLRISASAGDASAPAPADVASPLVNPRIQNPELSFISSSSSKMDFEVFLNFHGPDTRQGFVDVLYNRLVGAGIKVFRGEESLQTGEDITTELKEAIRQSSVMIPIFSKTYASSKWCLRELELMLESRDLEGKTIIPIFYDVSLADVRNQAGEFGKFFNLHEMDRVDSKTIETWRKVLRRIGSLGGLDRENVYGWSDANLVAEVVKCVLHKLRYHDQVITAKIVGIDLHVQEMMRKLGFASSETQASGVQGEDLCVVGIWGMPGVGTTTLAKVIYNKLHRSFDACSFIEDISSVGVSFSQRKLIADLLKQKPTPPESSGEGIKEIASQRGNVKALIILDDVNEDEQIGELIRNFTWLAPGSRIIVTTRKKELLSSAFDVEAGYRGMVEEHEVRPMSDDQALQLFWKHCFQGNASEDNPEYYDLSKEIVKAIGGVPLNIVIHASFLCRKMDIDTWKTTLELLRNSPKR